MYVRCLVLAAFLLLAMPVYSQGALEPANPPGLTMKSLDQIEPRIPLSIASIVSTSGNYYLTNDIDGTIILQADNIDLDLNGYAITILSPFAVNWAINAADRENIRIHNGRIYKGSGQYTIGGINGSGASDIRIHDLHISDVSGYCVAVDFPTGPVSIERVTCHRAGKQGISVRQTGSNALYAIVRDNIVSDSNTSTDIDTYALGVVHTGAGNLYAVVTGNRLLNNRYDGLNIDAASGNGQATDNLVIDHGNVGYRIYADVMFAKNYAAGNGDNYDVLSARASTQTSLDNPPGPWDNISE